MVNGQVEFEIGECLDFTDDANSDSEMEDENSEEENLSQDWQTEELAIGKKSFKLEYMKKVVEFYENEKKKKNKSVISRVLKRFKKVSDSSYIYRFKKYVNNIGAKSLKLGQIQDLVYDKFSSALLKEK
jgi:hypothetical protein